MKAYRHRYQRIPRQLPKTSPRTKLESHFRELKADIVKPPPREHKHNSWISKKTWDISDNRALLRQTDKLTKQLTRKLGRQFKASLNADCAKRAENVATEVEGHLESGELKKAWGALKGWYRAAENQAL